MRLSVSIAMAAKPERVFAVMTDIARWPQIIGAIDGVEVLTPGAFAVGTRFRETRKMFGRTAVEQMEVAELVPPQRFVLVAFNQGTRYRATHLLEAVGADTRLSLTFEGRAETLAARLMLPLGWLMTGQVRKQLETDLVDLRRAAEADGSPDPRSPNGSKGDELR